MQPHALTPSCDLCTQPVCLLLRHSGGYTRPHTLENRVRADHRRVPRRSVVRWPSPPLEACVRLAVTSPAGGAPDLRYKATGARAAVSATRLPALASRCVRGVRGAGSAIGPKRGASRAVVARACAARRRAGCAVVRAGGPTPGCRCHHPACVCTQVGTQESGSTQRAVPRVGAWCAGHARVGPPPDPSDFPVADFRLFLGGTGACRSAAYSATQSAAHSVGVRSRSQSMGMALHSHQSRRTSDAKRATEQARLQRNPVKIVPQCAV